MANFKFIRIISFGLILLFAIPASSARGQRDKEKEKALRDLCSKTNNSTACWKIIKSERRKFLTNATGVVAETIHLARKRANKIHGKLERLRDKSKDEKLKEKYSSCSKNYSDVIRDLREANMLLHKRQYRNITARVDDVMDEVKSCRNDFGNVKADPAHVGDINKDFGVYAELLKVAVDRLLMQKKDD